MELVLMRALMFFLLGVATVVGAQSQPDTEVKLPLKDYLMLVERAEAIARIRAEEKKIPEEGKVAQITAQRLDLRIEDKTASVKATYDVEVRGKALSPVSLRFLGIPQKATVLPAGQASVSWGEQGLRLVALQAGQYKVEVSGALGLREVAGKLSIGLPTTSAPVALTRVDMPADREWSCQGATVAKDVVEAGRRIVELATKINTWHVLNLTRQIVGEEAEKTLAKAVVVTIVTVRPEGTRRHDVVLYEVARGSIGKMTVDLPAGYDVDRLATDEGEQAPFTEGQTFILQRQRQLSGVGFLVVSSGIVPTGTVSLAPITTDVDVRARYVAFAASVACELEPHPKERWQRVDLGDLPEAVRGISDDLKLAAAWQGVGDINAAGMDVMVLPATPMVEALVSLRKTTTLLTSEGTLLHKDYFELAQAGSSVEIEVPAGSSLWSAEVGGVPVRTLERGGKTLVPLPLGAQTWTVINTVVVQKQAIPKGRSHVVLDAPILRIPVLRHDWQVLLPGENTYRLTGGTLAFLPDGVITEQETVPVQASKPIAPKSTPAPTLPAGNATIEGLVVDDSGSPLPGVMVEAKGSSGDAVAISDNRGLYRFPRLPSGIYQLIATLQGFVEAQTAIEVASGSVKQTNFTLRVGTFAEEVTVSAGAVALDSSMSATAMTISSDQLGQVPRARDNAAGLNQRNKKQIAEMQTKVAFQNEVTNLRQGLVGGVKPVPVSIPETGKVQAFSGVLPPPVVQVEFDVKVRR